MANRDHKQIDNAEDCIYCLERWPCQTARVLNEAAADIQAQIDRARAADWGKSRGKMAYIQGLGQARRTIEKV